MTQDGQLIALLPGNAVALGYIFRRDAHMTSGQLIHQAVMEHGVGDLAVTHPVAIPGLGEQIGGVGHALHTHSQTNVGLTQRHIITDDLQGPHPGGAVLVYADGVAAGGQPDAHTHLPGGQRALHGGVELTHGDLVHLGWGQTGPADGLLSGGDGQVTGGQGGKGPVKFADGSTAGADNDNFSHSVPPNIVGEG